MTGDDPKVTSEQAVAPAYAPPAYAPPPGFGPPPAYAPSAPPAWPGYPPPAYAPYGPPAWPGYPPAYPQPAWGQLAWFKPVRYGPAPGLAWGGIGARFGALVLDALVVLASVIGSGVVISAIDGGSSRTTSPAGTAVSLIWLFFFISYHPACWYIFNCTPGQKLLGLKVVRQTDGLSLGFGAVTVRYLIFCVETLIFPLGIVSAVMASEDPLKRSWHDEAARSVVVGRA